MFTCPNCRKRLVRAKTPHGFCYVCPGCRGRAAALTVLRRAIGPEPVRKFWREAQGKRASSGKKCPVCEKWMRAIPVSAGGREFPLDVCARCQFIWFDREEFDRFPPAPPPPQEKPERELPEKVREQIALSRLEVEKLRDSIEEPDEADGTNAPDDPWKWIPGLLGMPVEVEEPEALQ